MLSRCIALVLVIFFSPVFIIVSILILLEDGAPVFFKQRRVGKNNSLFWIYKFRSMKKSTPNVATHLLGNPDMYLLGIGKIIRMLSIDELPNLINIIRGEMVFVGPRPALYNQEDLIALRIDNGVDILKPGLTGWAQINGRDEIPIEKKVELDKFYLLNRSVKLDLNIIVKTFVSVVSKKNVSH
jgi:O-antigen biosynthesis protein WbqP